MTIKIVKIEIPSFSKKTKILKELSKRHYDFNEMFPDIL